MEVHGTIGNIGFRIFWEGIFWKIELSKGIVQTCWNRCNRKDILTIVKLKTVLISDFSLIINFNIFIYKYMIYCISYMTCTTCNLWLTLNDILFTSFPFDTLFGLVICYILCGIINGIIPRYYPYIKLYNLSYNLCNIYILLIAFQSLIPFLFALFMSWMSVRVELDKNII